MRRVACKATWCPPPGLPIVAGEMSRENAVGGDRSINLGSSSSGRCSRSSLRRTHFSLAFWASENRDPKSTGQGALPAWCLKPTGQVLWMPCPHLLGLPEFRGRCSERFSAGWQLGAGWTDSEGKCFSLCSWRGGDVSKNHNLSSGGLVPEWLSPTRRPQSVPVNPSSLLVCSTSLSASSRVLPGIILWINSVHPTLA